MSAAPCATETCADTSCGTPHSDMCIDRRRDRRRVYTAADTARIVVGQMDCNVCGHVYGHVRGQLDLGIGLAIHTERTAAHRHEALCTRKHLCSYGLYSYGLCTHDMSHCCLSPRSTSRTGTPSVQRSMEQRRVRQWSGPQTGAADNATVIAAVECSRPT